MQLTALQVFESTPVLAAIINDKRPLPQKGKYRLARLHAKLLPEYNTIDAQRVALITAYDHHEMVAASGPYDPMAPEFPKTKEDPLGRGMVPSEQFSVPADKLTEFNAAWKAVADTVITVDAEPIPLADLTLSDDANGSIEAHELAALGDLVAA